MDEKIQDLGNGKFYIEKDDVPEYENSAEYEYPYANNKKNFESLMKWKGLAGWWAYTHGIGLYARRKLNDNHGETAAEASIRARARYIGQESWYDEDNYFWILTDRYPKYLLCQLRISNHLTDFKNYWITHANEPLGIVNCDTVLNVKVIDKAKIRQAKQDPKYQNALFNERHGWVKSGRIRNTYQDAQWTMFSVEMVLDPEDKSVSPEGIKKFEEFIKDVQDGKQPKITIWQIRQWVDPGAYTRVNRKYVNIDPNNPNAGRKLYVRDNQLEASGGRANLLPSQWGMANDGRDFTRYDIPDWLDDEDKKPKNNKVIVKLDDIKDLDWEHEFLRKKDRCVYGKYNGKRVRLNTDKQTLMYVDKNGNSVSDLVMYVENRRRKNKLIESFDLSPIYIHNIIMESLERLLF